MWEIEDDCGQSEIKFRASAVFIRELVVIKFFDKDRNIRTAGKGLRRKFKMPHTRLLLPERLKGFIITV